MSSKIRRMSSKIRRRMSSKIRRRMSSKIKMMKIMKKNKQQNNESRGVKGGTQSPLILAYNEFLDQFEGSLAAPLAPPCFSLQTLEIQTPQLPLCMTTPPGIDIPSLTTARSIKRKRKRSENDAAFAKE